MTEAQARQFLDIALEEGLPALHTGITPVGGYIPRGINVGKPRSDRWCFATTIYESEEKARLVCALARAGARRDNTDMICDHNTYRITRIDSNVLNGGS